MDQLAGEVSDMAIARGTIVVVDGERGVFKVVDQAPGPAPTLWLLDAERHWRAFRERHVHPLGARCPRHPHAVADGHPHRRCPACEAIWQRDHELVALRSGGR